MALVKPGSWTFEVRDFGEMTEQDKIEKKILPWGAVSYVTLPEYRKRNMKAWFNIYNDSSLLLGYGNKSRQHADLANRYNETETKKRLYVLHVTYKNR